MIPSPQPSPVLNTNSTTDSNGINEPTMLNIQNVMSETNVSVETLNPVEDTTVFTIEQICSVYGSLQASNFNYETIMALEMSHLLETELWPSFPLPALTCLDVSNTSSQTCLNPNVRLSPLSRSSPESCFRSDGEPLREHIEELKMLKSSIMLITWLINESFRQRVETWTALELNDRVLINQSIEEMKLHKFRLFFYMAWFIFLHPQKFALSAKESAALVQLFIHVFQSLEQRIIRRVCMSLCALPTWYHLGHRQQEKLFNSRPELKNTWKAVQKRYRTVYRKYGTCVEVNGSSITLFDRFILLDRDALYLGIFYILQKIEKDITCKISKQNLQDIDISPASIIDVFSGSEVSHTSNTNTKQEFAKNDIENALALDVRNENTNDVTADEFLLFERCLEFLIDMLSQLPTRRFLRPIVTSQQFLPRLRLSLLYRHNEAGLIRQLAAILTSYEIFEIDDGTGEPLQFRDLESRHYDRLKELQMLFFRHFSDIPPLKEMAIGPISAYETATALRDLFQSVAVTHLLQISDSLGLVDALTFAESALAPVFILDSKTVDLGSKEGELNGGIEESKGTPQYKAAHRLLVEVLVNHLYRRPNYLEKLNELPLFPTESLIWDPNIVPTENYKGDFSLALPKLNLQFLTTSDYLSRNFHLFRLESTYQIREDIEDALYHSQPCLQYGLLGTATQDKLETHFLGVSRMALPLKHFSIVFVKQPFIGSVVPSEVRAEILIDLKNVSKEIRKEWDSLRQFDVLFLAAISAPTERFKGHPSELKHIIEVPEKFGVIGIRGCEIVETLDEEGQFISDSNGTGEQSKDPFGDLRTLRVLLDPYQYYNDIEDMAKQSSTQNTSFLDMYGSLNLVIRRKPAENNFKAILETIRNLMNDVENAVIPQWLHDLFLGYGDPTSAQYFKLQTELTHIDFYDTFFDLNHLQESFPYINNLIVDENMYYMHERDTSFLFRITYPSKSPLPTSSSIYLYHPPEDEAIITPYKLPPRNPYISSLAYRNKIRFTPAQIEAIRSGINPGLTLIVGPPGTGKTDTAIQIALLLHKNFPSERILVVAHSNQALNDLFEKILGLDIDERYLLRLGMGEKELRNSSDRHTTNKTQKDFSKWGRVNYMLERRLILLKKVDVLGASLGIPGDVGASCETAIQFYRLHIMSRIQRFRKQLASVGLNGKGLRVILRDMRESDRSTTSSSRVVSPRIMTLPEDKEKKKITLPLCSENNHVEEEEEEEQHEEENKFYVEYNEEDTIENLPLLKKKKTIEQLDDDSCVGVQQGLLSITQVLFPFAHFFSDVPNTLFPSDCQQRHSIIADQCFQYLEDLFKEIKECHAFELLRTLHDRAEYLVTRHAKIIAMTCTHASLVRRQLIDMRLRYDNLIMEEAAQVLEIETFIPMVLQKTESAGNTRLKRVILLGDHHQLPPVVKNRGFQQYGRLDQSMFARLIRLQVPYIQLDAQGRCRSSLRELFGWRYQAPPLKDLPMVSINKEFLLANPGFTYDYQFINVEDYEGHGESCPRPHFFQNLGEAEYAVALYMYMRLLGYPGHRIAILTTYNGQKVLIKDIIRKRCGWNPAIGWPGVISTVDRFQGQQSDYVILSLVRTRSVGYLRDVRRFIVAVSRARLGLYMIGRFKLFSDILELKPIFDYFIKRPTQLSLISTEKEFSTDRLVNDFSITSICVKDIYDIWDIVQMTARNVLASLHSPPPPSLQDNNEMA